MDLTALNAASGSGRGGRTAVSTSTEFGTTSANGLAAGSVTIASVHAARDALRSGWRPSASRAAGRASSDDAGPRTPALLLRQERGHQARTDSGSLRTKRSSAYRGSDEMTAAPWSSSSRVIEIAASVGTAVPRHKLDSA